MGFDNDCILNIQSLAGEYFCPVCHLLVYPNEALQAQCTHLYCKPCLTYVVSTTHACPYDNYRVTEADCKPLLESNKALADTIGNIQVHCLYYRTGCAWQGSLSDCISHCSSCSYGESPVLCNRCGVQIVHRQVQEHAQNCPGAQSQVQQPGTVQDSTSTGAVAAADQSQTTAQTGLPASQAQTSQAQTTQAQMAQASGPLVSGQDANQAANVAAQPQAAQATMPTAEQWYQQQQQYQQQYQQYYQQYPGYDPYQQQYQYYYQYQQGAQQYPQQPMQGYPPQAYGQAPPQVSGQAPAQPQLQAQQQVQPHAQPQLQQQPQAPSRIAQPPLQTNAQSAANAQPQVQSVVQTQPQMQAQGQVPPSQALPYNQSQPLPQAQTYSQQQPITQQPMQVPQYQQTHPQGQQPAQSYPPSQTQTQNYPYQHAQSQVQPQPHAQPTMQGPAHPPPQQNQPMNPSGQLQTQNAVTGYQSYPQAQSYPQPQPHPQAQMGSGHPMHVSGTQPQPPYPAQMQGKFPSQPSQMYPPQPYSNTANPQQPAMSSAQGQLPSGPPAQQVPVYSHSQQPGYPFQQRPGVQAAHQTAPQQYGQQQQFPGQGPLTQSQPPITAQVHGHGPSQTLQQSQLNYGPGYGAQPNSGQNYAARPVAAQGAGSQLYAQAAGLSGAGQVRPLQLNQTYPMRTDNQLSAASEQQAGHPQQSSRATGGEKARDPMLDKSNHDQNGSNKEVRDFSGASGAGVHGNEMKIKSENSLDGSVNGNKSKVTTGTGSKLLQSDAQEGKPRTKGDASEGVLEPSPGSNVSKNGPEDHKDVQKKAEVQDLKHTANSAAGASATAPNLPQTHIVPQVHGSNSFPAIDHGRNQLQPMQYGPSSHNRPGAGSMSQSMPHLNSQQPALGHPPGQLRPQGPGQAPARPPFNAAENSQPSYAKHPPGHENAPGNAPSGTFGRPGDMGYFQGNMPPFQAGQPQNPSGESFVGPSFAAQRPGAFDSHVGIGGRGRADIEQRPPYPMESENFQAQRPGFFDGRKPESLSHGSMERVPYGPAHPGNQPGAMKFGGPSAHDSVSAPGMRDERGKLFPEEHLKSFPHRNFEDEFRKFPPSHFEAGPSSKHGTQFPSSGPLDHDPATFSGDGMSRPFDKAPHGFDRDSGLKIDSAVGYGPSRFLRPLHHNDAGERGRPAGFPDDDMGRGDFGHRPGPGFGRSRMDGLPPRSPGRDFSGFPSRTFGAYGDVVGNESRPFEGSRPYNFPADPFGKPMHENRFPVPPNHLQRGELDVPGNLRLGEHLVGGPRNPDMLPGHLRREHMGPRNLHMGEATAFGPSGGLPRMGEPPLPGNFPQHLPYGDSFGGEKPGHPLMGEPGFRGSPGFQRYAREGGFYPEEMDPFDNPRKRKPGSIMCRICKVECGTVEGLDLHSQSREHQRKARDMVLSIKHQNKKQKISKDQAAVEGRDGGRPKKSSFQGRGNKR